MSDLTFKEDQSPEWWARDREFFCDYCGHSAYRHRERMGDSELAPCGECACEDFASEAADDPQLTTADCARIFARWEIA